MTIAQIDTNVQKLVKKFKKETFIYDLCLAFGLPKSTVTLLRKGNSNLSKIEGEVLLKKKFLFKELNKDELESVMTTIRAKEKIKHNPRFVILTDYKTILAYDTKTDDTLDTTIKNLTKEFAFFLPLAGMEKIEYQNENPADVKAAEKMAKLFDEIKKHNPTEDAEEIHSLNVFLSRLLFCFFAEDTNIFTENQFTNAIASYTQEDGEDLNSYLSKLFDVLNKKKRTKATPKHLTDFPYVNGGLFRDEHQVPKFSRKARRILIECGELDWAAINPDIFGSMIQAVVTPEHRGGLGMHYTSVPNIMKVIEPLFLNNLYEDFEKSKNSPNKLNALLQRLSNLKIFDPACGSGNFLIIAYKELRQLENKIILHQLSLRNAVVNIEPKLMDLIPKNQLRQAASFVVELFSRISLDQFYGIELDDFAHEIAKLSLWLAEHQMNTLFTKAFGQNTPSLPLKETGHIVHGNACRLDWDKVCPKEDGKEIYILGNPPYMGAKNQNSSQKEDMKFVFEDSVAYKKLDYITCWFKKATDLISNKNSKFAFVSTNSICQGEQVSLLWPYIFYKGCEIEFAYSSFHWKNNARDKAGITCIIAGVSPSKFVNSFKYIFKNENRIQIKNISPYLIAGSNLSVFPRTNTLSNLPLMVRGSQPTDNGNLILSKIELDFLLKKYPTTEKIIKKYIGANEFINNKMRWCIWITDNNIKQALAIPEIQSRIKKCKEFRLQSKKKATRSKAESAFKFDEIKHQDTTSIIFPVISSHRREYIPIGFLNQETVISNKAQVIYNAKPFMFAILTSKMHMKWLSITSSRMRKDYQYSNKLSYNTFPIPNISNSQIKELESHVYNVLSEREKHSEKTLAQLYDPDKMPDGLRAAHHALDIAVEQCYRKAPFTSDEERLAYLFKLYEKMIKEEEEKETLFAKQQKKSKKKKSKA